MAGHRDVARRSRAVPSRREVLRLLPTLSAAASPVSAWAVPQFRGPGVEFPTSREPRRRQELPAATLPLRERFADLRRHFVFEYYPWSTT
jgi:hypothetical protein